MRMDAPFPPDRTRQRPAGFDSQERGQAAGNGLATEEFNDPKGTVDLSGGTEAAQRPGSEGRRAPPRKPPAL